MIFYFLFMVLIAIIAIIFLYRCIQPDHDVEYIFFGVISIFIILIALFIPLQNKSEINMPDEVLRSENVVVLVKDDICVMSTDTRIVNNKNALKDYRIKTKKYISCIGAHAKESNINKVIIKKGENLESDNN